MGDLPGMCSGSLDEGSGRRKIGERETARGSGHERGLPTKEGDIHGRTSRRRRQR